ncbi:MAG: hypothetical protein JWP81_2540 [Ferruginibacter sp.]|nr:hypothetical protein [Ferruginibacter sp.]
MKKANQNKRLSRRKFLVQSTFLSGGFLAFPFTSRASNFLSFNPNNQEILKAVVLGDSAMWGQGLKEADKYSTISVAAVGRILGREAKIETNLAHSGAAIEASKEQRKKFANTYPSLFAWTDFTDGATTKLAEDFVNKKDEDPTVFYGDVPSTFPTISYQVSRVPSSTANKAELVLINGGANDLDFEEFLHPLEHRDDFVHYYEPLLKEYTFTRVMALLKATRIRFPKAVIVFTGYFSPFAPNTSNSAIKNLFYHLKGVPHFARRANELFNYKNPDQLVIEAQYRSHFGLTRGLYWTRKAIADLNNNPDVKGPGILFVHPCIAPKHSVFTEDSYFHKNYKISEIKDSAKELRFQNIPRLDKEDEFKHLYNLLAPTPQGINAKSQAEKVLKNLNGSKDLINALHHYISSPGNYTYAQKLRGILSNELERLDHAKIASFLHPNEKGAQRYADEIVSRYAERLYRVNIGNDIIKFNHPRPRGSNDTERVADIFKRYGLQSYNISPANASQLMLVDSIGLEIQTTSNSEKQMFDNIFLNLGDQHRWQLNFPYEYELVPLKAIKWMHNQFNPGYTDFFTMDGLGVHLSSIDQFTLEREKGLGTNAGSRPLTISKIILYLNGINVYSVSSVGNLNRDGRITLPYPIS